MNFYIAFQTGLCLIFCTSTRSDLITPTTFNDMIIDLKIAEDESENTTKPWLVYIDAEINYSILSCLQVDKFGHFFVFWKCLLKCSPVCDKLKKKIKKRCRTRPEHIRHRFSSGIFPGDPMTVPPEQTIAGSIFVSAETCRIFREHVEHAYPTEVVHVFKTDPVFRVNVTFTKFELIDDEMVGFINGNDCRRGPATNFEDIFLELFYNCFKVQHFLLSFILLQLSVILPVFGVGVLCDH